MVTHSSIVAGIIPQTEKGYSPWDRKESDTTELESTLTCDYLNNLCFFWNKISEMY